MKKTKLLVAIPLLFIACENSNVKSKQGKVVSQTQTANQVGETSKEKRAIVKPLSIEEISGKDRAKKHLTGTLIQKLKKGEVVNFSPSTSLTISKNRLHPTNLGAMIKMTMYLTDGSVHSSNIIFTDPSKKFLLIESHDRPIEKLKYEYITGLTEDEISEQLILNDESSVAVSKPLIDQDDQEIINELDDDFILDDNDELITDDSDTPTTGEVQAIEDLVITDSNFENKRKNGELYKVESSTPTTKIKIRKKLLRKKIALTKKNRFLFIVFTVSGKQLKYCGNETDKDGKYIELNLVSVEVIDAIQVIKMSKSESKSCE